MPTPTLRDVADAAGVHPATASRALNPATRGLVNTDTARRVMRVAESLGYRPNPIARGLKTARSGTIGLVIPDLTNPLFPPIVRGIEDVLEAGGYTGLIVSTDNDQGRERSQIELLRSRQVEGLIIATAQLHHPLLEQLQADGVPMVMVNRRPEGIDVSSITPDDAAGIELAVRHLAELGHRRIAHLAGPATTSTGMVRARSFRSSVRELGLVDDPDLTRVCQQWSERAGAEALRSLLDAGAQPTAVVAGNDLIALGCYDVFAERGIVCPARHERGRLQRHAVPRQAQPTAEHRVDPPPPDRRRGRAAPARVARRPEQTRALDDAPALPGAPGFHGAAPGRLTR